MLQALSQKHRLCAWFFVLVLYCELSAPFIAKAAQKPEAFYPLLNRNAGRTQRVTDWLLKNAAGNGSIRKPLQAFSSISSVPVMTLEKAPIMEAANTNMAGGPGQPEMQAFSSVNHTNMVDPFTGDFSYNIPLLDVGGYPVNLSYRSGISMDQEASWVGLGWNVNPGTISRNLRGLPDDFNGTDSIKKTTSIKENKTVGVTVGGNAELTGLPLVNLGINVGVFHNNYRGWGLESGVNVSLNSGSKASGPLSGGLSLTNNSQEGLTLVPSLTLKFNEHDQEEKAGLVSSFSTSLPYNSRTGLKALQLSMGLKQTKTDEKNQYIAEGGASSFISFASPSYTPSITMPFTSRQYSFTANWEAS